MLATPALIDGSISNYWAGVIGKGNRIIPRWRPNKKRKRISLVPNNNCFQYMIGNVL
jgi:hypothetical protein